MAWDRRAAGRRKSRFRTARTGWATSSWATTSCVIRRFSENIRTGSHNVVVGQRHNFSRFGGLVVGDHNTISGDFASVSGGDQHGQRLVASVSGGRATRPAASWPRSAAGRATRPVAVIAVRSAGGVSQRFDRQRQHACGVVASVSGGRQHGQRRDSAGQRRAEHYPRDGVRLVGGIGS